MRNKNTILAAAITATLAMMNQAYALDVENEGTSTTLSLDVDSITNTSSSQAVFGVPADGIVYGSHLFGSDTPEPLPDTTTTGGGMAAVKYTVEGSIGFAFDFEVTLSNGAKFSGDPILGFVDSSGASNTPNFTGGNGCASDTQCIWTVNMDSVPDPKLKDGSLFYVFYQLGNTDALGTPGETIELSATLGSTLNGNLATDLAVTVAQSIDPLIVDIKPGEEDANIRISVSSNNTEFVSTAANSTEWVSANEAVIGYLSINNDTNAVAADGSTSWDLGNSGFEAGFDADNSIGTGLSITSGQFNASITGSSGSVYIALPGKSGDNIDNSGGKIDAQTVTSTTAFWELSDTDLQALTAAVDGGDLPAIVIETDGTNTVNIEENPPEATLEIDYVDGQQDITYGPTELVDFRQDGTTCWVYNVPPPSTEGVADVLNLRITNDSSSVSGIVYATMYPMKGDSTSLTNPVFSGINLLGDGVELGAYQSVRITADDISALGGDTPYVWWEDGGRRGSMYISSTLPKLEIMVLMRDQNTMIMTNLSTGAHGVSCEN